MSKSKGARAHRAREYMHTLVDTRERLDTALKTLRSVSEEGPNLAVDGEGFDYSRRGRLSLIVIATRDHVFLFDIVKLGKRVFDRGLRKILEDPTREKLMFDCREDSDILWHQYNVELDGVLDIQLLQVMFCRRDDSDLSPFGRQRGALAPCVKVLSLLHCLEQYADDVTSTKIKKSVGSTFAQSPEQWMVRPIPSDMIKYACVDVSTLFVLYDKMKMGKRNMRRLKVASARYVSLKRSIKKRRYDIFERNGYLPLNVIPEKGHVDFSPYQSSKGPKCVGCQRRFPREAFTKTQLRNGEQKCKVCRKVKHSIDVQRNKEENCESDSSEDDSDTSEDDSSVSTSDNDDDY
ncbi:piRNA biogenesis protein EXD1 [Lingula anatina]|uniref:PiRNA biogenesis protein EXD1 n=1 Tax=Lingula anatina TaxID=7574 RepID=A0A1S3H1V6_LINAN|nr:piRNA biogenesis protein EXD1 [Lingula anatina]XP_013380003.1 piRNA biogenesis protein EXD1 [Lingula anatina]XP_013380009.1 piRNA biogenesis protein EXD1 [Lingula anatina]XP_013380016.1 piRNA biogenesis protein EXD1 [Lingula anatina]|eukprot:XP_013379994.1 piRNA biogenesis protein EXD1 [Lingula anatina]